MPIAYLIVYQMITMDSISTDVSYPYTELFGFGIKTPEDLIILKLIYRRPGMYVPVAVYNTLVKV